MSTLQTAWDTIRDFTSGEALLAKKVKREGVLIDVMLTRGEKIIANRLVKKGVLVKTINGFSWGDFWESEGKNYLNSGID